MADYATLLARCEGLYAEVCMEPESWPDTAIADWAEGIVHAAAGERAAIRELRRVIRAAQRMRDFWAEPAEDRPPDYGDWRTRVDIGLGVRAWRPLLAIARRGLQESPTSDLFDDVKARFRVVTGERWMDGVDFETWLAGRG